MVHSLYQSLNNLETIYADRIGIRYYDEAKGGVVEVPFRQYAADLRRFVAFLRSRTPNPLGQRVAILARNSYHYVMCMYGAVLAGAVAVPLNTGKNWDEIRYELDLVEPVCVLHDGEYMSREPALGQAYGDRLVPMDAFTAFEPAMDITEVPDLSALAFIMFTSGTTGRSKGVMLCERNFFAVMPHHVRVGQRFCQLKNDPDLLVSHMTLLPMFHLGAFGCLFTWAWMGWAQNLGSLRSFYKDLKRMPSQAMAAVPVLVQSIHHDLMTGKQDKLGDLWALNCMSAMFDPQTLMDLHDHGMVISQLYGSTETTGGGLINFAEDAKHIGSIGKDDGHCEIKLDNGELCMRGGDVMLGYYKDPEGTAEVVDAEGWFHTGDLARVDEDGYYFLTGRKKNVIILDSGENVSPEELEGLLEKCPAVKECLVKEKGKKICAVVCCKEADQQTVRDFITETNRTLPLYKRMSAVEFSAQPLPRNAMGKLMR